MMARPDYSYRGQRKRNAHQLKQVWRALERIRLGDGSVYIPPIRISQEKPDGQNQD